MARNILVARAAQKQFARFPARDRGKIGAALRSLEAGPFSGDIIKLEGAGNRWRRRIGNYRIFFSVATVGSRKRQAKAPAPRHLYQDSGR